METEPDRFSHEAMATTFQVFVIGEEKAYAQQAADAVFAEVDRLEKELSRFADTSDVSQINHLAPNDWAKVGLDTLECLKVAARASAGTGGAFDVTIGPLMACWRDANKKPRQPSDEELAAARAKIGMQLIERDDANQRVRVKVAGVRIDLGGIGKGYAIERGAEILKEWSIKSALISAGDSSVYAFGAPPGKDGWPTGVGGVGNQPEAPYTLLLRDRSLSGSGSFLQGRHIMDPRTGHPAVGRSAAWSLHASPTLADALSTAFVVMTPEQVERYCRAHPDTSAMIVPEGTDKRLRFGPWPGLQTTPG